MSTSIEWTDETWNPTTGCDRVSPGCDHCYALTLAKRLKGMGSAKYQNDGDPRTSGPGFGLTVHPDTLNDPFTWAKPRKVFVNSMSDLFHARVPLDFVRRVFEVIEATPQHTYQVLTKRASRLPRVADKLPWPRNLWMGVSVENQEEADRRIPPLLDTPAAVRFVSAEPLLGPVSLDMCNWNPSQMEGFPGVHNPLTGEWWPAVGDAAEEYANRVTDQPRIDWVIVGGESGPGARPMHLDWARSLRDQCQQAGVPFLFKQHGAWAPWCSHGEGEDGPGDTFVNPDGTTGHAWFNENLGYPTNHSGPWNEHSQLVSRIGKKRAGRELDGRTWDEFPDSRVILGETTGQDA